MSEYNEYVKEAKWYRKLSDEVVQCLLCPFKCVLNDAQRGKCKVRENRRGILYTLVYGRIIALHQDPIEKKPFYHVLPSKTAFSLATPGCNLSCKFCQNSDISQIWPEDASSKFLTPLQVVKLALKYKAPTIAYTYSEPIIFYEFMLETAKLAKEKGILNLMVTNGYINEAPLRELCKFIDAANVDLKGFDPNFYHNIVGGNLDEVLNSLKVMKKEGIWIEITNLVIPGLNDSAHLIRRMCKWIRENLGPETPIHFSKFYPMYKLRNIPPTPLKTLEQACEIAKSEGLNYVYIGNVPGHILENTYCPNCKNILIKRLGYMVSEINIDKEGKCKFCNKTIPGIWKSPLQHGLY